MAKYCMFCGEELPDKALFCPSCGQKQETTTVNTSSKSNNNHNIDYEEDDDEMDILLKYGMMYGSSKPKEEPKPKVITLDYKPEVDYEEPSPIQEKKEEDLLEVINKNFTQEKPTVVEKPIVKEKPVVKEEPVEEKIVEEKPIIKTTPKEPKKEEPVKVQPIIEERPKQDETPKPSPVVKQEPKKEIIKEEIKEEVKEEVKKEEPKVETPVVNTNYWDYDDDDDEEEEEDFDIISDEEASMQEEFVGNKAEFEVEESDPTPTNRHNARRRDVSIKKRSVSIEEDEDEFDLTYDSNKVVISMYESATMHADEKADFERRKNIKITDLEEEKLDDRSHLEGRKQQTQKVEKRRKSQRTYNEKKYYEIEHDKSQLEENEDPEYDGYYENVLPIDHDQERKSKIDIKTIAIVFALLVGCALMLYFGLSML